MTSTNVSPRRAACGRTRTLTFLATLAAAGCASLAACGGGGGGSASATGSSSAPMVSAVSAAAVPVGSSVAIQGRNLDQAGQFRVGSTALAATAVNASSATLQMPQLAVSGPLTIVYNGAATVTTPYTLTAFVPVVIGALSADAGSVGAVITASGSSLDQVTAVTLPGNAGATIAAQSPSTLSFVVPARAAGSGPIVFASAFQQVDSPAGFTVTGPVRVTSTTAQLGAGTLSIDIVGVNLLAVTGATVGGVAASIASQSQSRIVLGLPASAAGAIVLAASGQADVPAGAVMHAGAYAVTLASTEFAQVLDHPALDGALPLTAGKSALARVALVGQVAALASPTVTLSGTTAGGGALGVLTLSGPATLPSATDPGDLATTFNGVVPGAWLAPGVTLSIGVAGGAIATALATTLQPTIATPARIHVVVVPLTVGGLTAVVPAASAVRDLIARAYPYAPGDIRVEIRAPLSVTGVGYISTAADMSTALGVVESVREQESPDAFYYAMFPAATIPPSGSVATGLGYINPIAYTPGTALSAVGTEATWGVATVDPFGLGWEAWNVTLLHELGHNHSLAHAPCGGAAGPDPNFPYAGGQLGPQPVYASLYADATIGALSSSTTPSGTMSDAMGYCGGAWFSDYHYAKLQQFAENRTLAVPAPGQVPVAPSGDAAAPGTLVLSGTIDDSGLALNPARAMASAPPAGARGDAPYALRVTTVDGATLVVPFDAIEVSETGGRTRHFQAALANPGPVGSVDVLRYGSLVPLATRAAAPQALRADRASAAEPAFTMTPTSLTLAWDALAMPYASVSYVAPDGARRVIALRLDGGAQTVALPALPAGGRIEISLSSATTARVIVLPHA